MNRLYSKSTLWLMLLVLLPTTQINAQRHMSMGKAKMNIETFYSDLNTYAEQMLKHRGQVMYETSTNRLIDACVDDCLVSPDIWRLDGRKNNVLIKLTSYLIELKKYAQQNTVRFSVDLSNMKYEDVHRDTTCTNRATNIVLTVQAPRKSYRCSVEIGFKDEKISYIKCGNYEDIPNITGTDVVKERPKEFDFSMGFAEGFKIGKDRGITAGLTMDGLSENWFWSRVRYGIDFVMSWSGQDIDRYPSATTEKPATMRYKNEQGEPGVGLRIGYTLYPGKYNDRPDNDNWFNLSLNMGFGGQVYDCWKEWEGGSKWKEHRSVAPYVWPSVHLDFIAENIYPGLFGIDVGYFLCPEHTSVNGLTIMVSISYIYQ